MKGIKTFSSYGWLLFLFLLCVWHPLAEAQNRPERHPVPSNQKTRSILKTIGELYREAYDQGPSAYPKLADELMKSAQTSKIPAEKYVLLRESIRLNVEVGKMGQALNGLQRLVDQFKLQDEFEFRQDYIKELSSKIADEFSGHQLLRFGKDGFEKALKQDDFASARQQLKQLQSLARKGKYVHWQNLFKREMRRLKEIEEAYESVEKDYKILKRNPDSPESNLRVANYILQDKDDIESALPYYAKSSSQKVRSLAKKAMKLSTKLTAQQRKEIAFELEELGQKTQTFSPLNMALSEFKRIRTELVGLEAREIKNRISNLQDELSRSVHITEFFGRKWNVKWKNGHAPWMDCHFLSSDASNVAVVRGKKRRLAYRFLDGKMLITKPPTLYSFVVSRWGDQWSYKKLLNSENKVVDSYQTK